MKFTIKYQVRLNLVEGISISQSEKFMFEFSLGEIFTFIV